MTTATSSLLSSSGSATLNQKSLGGQSGDGFAVNQHSNSAALTQFVKDSTGPLVATGPGNTMHVVDGLSPDGQGVMVQNAQGGSPTEVSTTDFMEKFTYVDRGHGGKNDPYTASKAAAGLVAGQHYYFQGLVTDSKTRQASVNLQETSGKAVTVSLADFHRAFGASAAQQMLNNAVGSPAPLKSSDISAPFSNSELFPAGGLKTSDLTQSATGDCYFDSTLASLTQIDPNYLSQMVRPSTSGNPNEYDVKLYAPDAKGNLAGQWVTVDNTFPVGPNGKPTGIGIPVDPTTGKSVIGPALIEKAFAKLNEEHPIVGHQAGYTGIQGGYGSAAMQVLTGRPAGSASASQLVQKGNLWNVLSTANQGRPVTVDTVPGNTPQNFLAPNIVQNHEYAVLKTYTDASGQQMVQLRNPWGMTGSNDQPNDPSTHGVFDIPLTQLQPYLASVNQGSPLTNVQLHLPTGVLGADPF